MLLQNDVRNERELISKEVFGMSMIDRAMIEERDSIYSHMNLAAIAEPKHPGPDITSLPSLPRIITQHSNKKSL